MLLQNGTPRMVGGTPGSFWQVQTNLQWAADGVRRHPATVPVSQGFGSVLAISTTQPTKLPLRDPQEARRLLAGEQARPHLIQDHQPSLLLGVQRDFPSFMRGQNR